MVSHFNINVSRQQDYVKIPSRRDILSLLEYLKFTELYLKVNKLVLELQAAP
jgi:hypothetical protein